MKDRIKAVFFDVDQTLLSHRDGCIPKSALEAVLQLQKRGVKIILSTGRHPMELNVLDKEPIRFDGYNILNGQMCLDEERKVFFESPITGEDREALLALYEKKQVPVTLVGRGRLHINYIDDLVRKVMKRVPAQMPVCAPFDEGVLFMGGIYCPREKDSEYTRQFKGLRLTRWHEYAADIIPVNAGKVQGMKVFLDRYHLDREEIMAFGDEENDIQMLSFAGIGVAMGNAPAAVREAADYVTSHIDEDGVRRAFEHFGML